METKHNEIKICPEVERIICNNDFGGKMIVACNELPLFLITNLIPINNRILKNEGSLEIISRDFSKLYKIPTKLNGDVQLYKTSRDIQKEFSVIYEQNLIITNKDEFLTDENKFTLFENRPHLSKEFHKVFSEMCNSDNVIKEDYLSIYQ